MGFATGPKDRTREEKTVTIIKKVVERPVFKDVVIERPIFKERIVENVTIIEKEVIIEKPVIKEVEKIVEVPRIIYKDVVVERPVYKTVEVTQANIVTRTQEVVHTVPKIKYVDEIVKVPRIKYIEEERIVIVPKIVHKTVYVEKPVINTRIIEETRRQFKCEKCGHVHEEVVK